ncbi:MAG: DUF2726 domain-containing protein [Rubrivivax sp.]|nr:DUF2726 domain-containing protein [Rubrivivax sp.]
MELFPPFVLPATALLLLSWLFFRWRSRQSHDRRSRGVEDAPDTVAGWPPEAARVLTINERQALDLLKRAMPGSLVLAQVPLSRFVRVPTRRSYGEWLSRVGALSADLLLCDAGSRPMAVIDIRASEESDRSRRRHERLGRVLRAAGVHVVVWREGHLPSAAEVRTTLMPLLGPVATGIKPTSSGPMPLIPVADVEELLSEGDARHGGGDAMEPVPSAFFDDALDAVRR